METFLRELRFAGRSLIRRPGFTATGLGTLAVGLGAAVAIFTVVNGVLLEPLPFPESDRLVSVYHTMSGQGVAGEWPLTRHTYLLFRDENRTFEEAGAYVPVGISVVDGERATEEDAVLATPGLWRVLGVRAAAGRLLDEDDSRPGAPPVAVLDHGFWQRRFGGDPGVVGRTLEVDGEIVEVVGVAEEHLRLPGGRIGQQEGEGDVALWLPYELDPAAPVTDEFRLHLVARLREGVQLSRARADVGRLTDLLSEEFPQIFSPETMERFGLRTHVRTLRETVVGDVDRTLWIVFAGVGVVLLIACGNVATLFMVRAEGRRREVTLRSALGAGRGAMVLHFLAESFLLAALAGLIGLGLAHGGVRLLLSMAPPTVPRLPEIGIGWESAAFTGGLVVLAALFLGAYPVLRFGGRPSTSQLGERQATEGPDVAGRNTRDALVVAQVAMALVLLAASAVLVESFRRLADVDPGFSSEGVLAVEVALPPDRYGEPEESLVFWRQAVDRLEGRGAIRRAAIGPVPLEMGTGCSGMVVEGRPFDRSSIECVRIPTVVSPGYWDLLEISTVEGRLLRFDDAESRSGAAVITRDLARRLWPDQSALGQGIKPFQPGPPFYRVAGVVEPIRGTGLADEPTEVVFLPMLALEGEPGWNTLSTNVLVKASGDEAEALTGTVRSVLSELEGKAAVGRVRTLEDVMARSMIHITFPMTLLGIAAAAALFLGSVGLYGVMAHRVRSRETEMGIRMALGASGGAVRGLVFRRALILTALGVGIGVAGALVLNRGLASLAFGVRPGDPRVLAAAAVLLMLVSSVAAWIPALRATRIDPAKTLRAE